MSKVDRNEKSGSVVSISNVLNEKQLMNAVKKEILVPLQDEKRKKSKLNTLLMFVTAIAVILSALLATDTAMTHEKIAQAEAKIKTDIAWMQKIEQAMLAMRTFDDKVRLAAKEGKKIDIKKINVERLTYEREVADANTGARNVLGINISNSNLLFNRFDESVSNILSKSAPTDTDWRNYEVRNDLLIGLKIEKQEAIIRHEREFILTRFIGDIKFWLKRIF